MIRASAAILLAVLVVVGCARTTAFGPDEEARLVLARGEADYQVGESDRDVAGWREAFCDSEQEAEEALREKLHDEVTRAWGMAALKSGNDLPTLTDSEREEMVSALMEQAKLVSSGEPRPGSAESYMALRLSGDFPRCLSQVQAEGVGDHCGRPPQEESQHDCRARSEPPSRLYYLEES